MRKAITCCALQTNFTKSEVLDSRAAPTICAVQDDIQLSDQPQKDDFYGQALAVSEDESVLVVGALGYRILVADLPTIVGAVFIYNLVGEKYILQQVILHPLLQVGTFFGENIAISADGQTFIVSAQLENESFGAVYVYERNNCEKCFKETEKLVSSIVTEKKGFGQLLALSPDGSVCMIKTDSVIEIFIKKSKKSKFESAGILDFDSDIASQLLGKKVLLEGVTAISLSKNGKLAALGTANAKVDNNETGGVMIFERSACRDQWIFVDFLADQPTGFQKSRIGLDVVLTPSGEDLIAFSGASFDPVPNEDFPFTVVYSLKNKYFQATQFIVPSATQIALKDVQFSYVDISDNGCFLSIAYACTNDNKGQIEIFSRRSNQNLFTTFQPINADNQLNQLKFGQALYLSGDGKALFGTSVIRTVVDENEFFEYQVTVFNSKKIFAQ